MRNTLNTAALVIMNTIEARKKLLREMPELNKKRVVTITNGFDYDDFKIDSIKLNSKKLLGKLGFCGRWMFATFFVKSQYNDWMAKTLNDLKKDTEIPQDI